jgi:hypothetical protein
MPVRTQKLLFLLCAVVAGLAAHAAVSQVGADEKLATSKDAAIERTRREVRLVDDIYKTTVVLVTEHYVNEETDLAAGSAAKALFDAVGKKGWHKVRLVDATGQPYNDENLPKEGFEKRAVKALLSGKSEYDEVVTENGKRVLHAATPIPVVLEKCIMCHENYREVEKGKAIGILSYQVPVQE